MNDEVHAAGDEATATYYGVYCAGPGAKDVFWNITCPCGVTQTYALNHFPEKDTPHKCGNPNHWVVKFDPAPGGGESMTPEEKWDRLTSPKTAADYALGMTSEELLQVPRACKEVASYLPPEYQTLLKDWPT